MNPYAVNSPPVLSANYRGGISYLSLPLRSSCRIVLARAGRIQLCQRPVEYLGSCETRSAFDALFQIQYSRDAAVIEHDQVLGKCFHIGRIMRDHEHRHFEAQLHVREFTPHAAAQQWIEC